MTLLRIALAILLCVGSAFAARAEDPLSAEQASKALNSVARDLSIGASMASKAAADALLAPSNERKFATSKSKDAAKRSSDSVGGSAAAAAAGSEGQSSSNDAEEPGTPLPIRKPKPVYGSGGKSYEAANGKTEAKSAAAPPDVKDAPGVKDTSGVKDKKPSDAKAQPSDAKAQAATASESGKTSVTKKDAKADAGAKTGQTDKKGPGPTEWPALEIELAKARCTQLLKGLDVVTVPETPFRQGECGAPAPVRLVSIGKNPEVAVSPPALVSCDMVAGLHKWLKDDLQPLARKHLGADIVRIETMSDYSCRRAYGRIANRLSEHGKANALDIRGFITAKAKTAYVLEEWGQTRRDVLRKLAAAEAEAKKADAARLEAEKKAQDNLRDPKAASAGEKGQMPPAATALKSGSPAGGIAKTTIIDGLSKLTVTLPGAKTTESGEPATDAPTAMGIAPRRLGGPKDGEAGEDKKQSAESNAKPAKDAKPGDKAALANPIETGSVLSPAPRTATSRFLHEAHIAACRIFGTTLGPEANEAHRNHFHVDMAERKITKICE
jgi:hypothetical protein